MRVSKSLHARAGRLSFLALSAGLALAATGCTDKRGGPIPYDVSDFGVPDSPSVAALESNYKIAPMDTLNVRVFRMDDLSGDYQVDLAGNISMPLIGEVKAVDVTTAELDSILTRRFGEKYLENPDISVGIKASAGRSVTVDGAVEKAGAFPVGGPMTLMQAVALAGGMTDDANERRIAVFRQIDGQRQAAAFDMVSIRRGEMDDPQVYAGDIIIVDGSSNKSLLRDLLRGLPVLSIFRPI